MNAPLPWHDPVVAEIHAIREALAREFSDDLLAYSNAALAKCAQMHFEVTTPNSLSSASLDNEIKK